MKQRFAAMILAVPLAVAALAGCSSSSGGGTNGWDPSYEKNFMSSCDPSGANTEMCQCVFDELQAKYSADEFAELDKKIAASDPEATKELTEFMTNSSCIKQ